MIMGRGSPVGILLENMCCLGWPVSFGNSSISMLVLFDSVEIAKFSHLKNNNILVVLWYLTKFDEGAKHD